MGYEHVRFHVIYIQKRKGEEEDTRKVQYIIQQEYTRKEDEAKSGIYPVTTPSLSRSGVHTSIDKLPDSGRGMDVKRREEAQDEEKRESERRKGRRKGETERAADVPMSSSTPCTSMIQE
jgi:hypothetical protein